MSGLGAGAKEHEQLQWGQLPPGSTQTHCLQTKKKRLRKKRARIWHIQEKRKEGEEENRKNLESSELSVG